MTPRTLLTCLLVACGSPENAESPHDVEASSPTSTSATSSDSTEAATCGEGIALSEGRVSTSSGVVEGAREGEVWSLLAVPYAEPPTGALRFAPPEPYACREGEVLDGSSWGAACPQRDEEGEIFGDEDCLHLNVWTPAELPLAVDEAADRPVMVFLHGGGHVQGGNNAGLEDGLAYYDGALLAARTGAVVVTPNYRLGALGFLAHEAIGGGNQGLRDQLLALEWVRDNAAALGGDPERVMVFGESAGAVSVCDLLTSPLAEGLIHGALLQSGSCRADALVDRQTEGAEAAEALGCVGDADAVRTCLLEASWEDLAALSEYPISETGIPGGGGFGPTVDGEVLPRDPATAMADGEWLDVPLVVGSNKHETGHWVGVLTDADYEALVAGIFGLYTPQALEIWPLSNYSSARWAWIDLTTDVLFTCPARETLADAGRGWRYLFSRRPNGISGTLYGARHGLEILYVFQQIGPLVDRAVYTADAIDYDIEEAMAAGWSGLADAGDPAVGPLQEWPAWTPEGDEYLVFGDAIAPSAGLKDEACDFLATLTP